MLSTLCSTNLPAGARTRRCFELASGPKDHAVAVAGEPAEGDAETELVAHGAAEDVCVGALECDEKVNSC